MEEIGNLFLQTRESAGITLREVSEDLKIDEAILENIEDGKSGAFKDVYVLKDYISSYAKYLGLDAGKILDEFNEYVFEATSKIPIKEIEKQIHMQQKSEEENKVVSPYTRIEKKYDRGLYIIILILLVILLFITILWSIKQISNANHLAYIKGVLYEFAK